jgi:diguanylate cyclase (GGDEF)-like protein
MTEVLRGRRSAFGSFIVDGRDTILGFDEAIEALTGWPAVDVVGRPKELGLPGVRFSPSAPRVPLFVGSVREDSAAGNLALALNCRDGRRLDVEVLRRPLNGPGDRLLVTVLRVLSSSAPGIPVPDTDLCDPLTGLPDRDAFFLRLGADFAHARIAAKPLSLLLLDVDHLRLVNDRAGRGAGDDVLQKIAGILRVTVEDERRIARLGSDDFAVLLQNGGRGDARQVASALRSKVERFRFLPTDAADARVTISLGTASFPADADDERELVDRAADALEEARAMGRNRVWCYLRRPRVPLQVPVYFDGADASLLGYTRDLSPSGIFLQTTAGIDVGMRCALAFPLPGHDGRVHVVGRVVRTVLAETANDSSDVRIPGVGVEFERFGGNGDRRAIDVFLHGREATSHRPENGLLSVRS